MTTTRHIALIINPLHQKALQVGAEISELLLKNNISHAVFKRKWPNQWTEFTEAWIVGGDGTLNYFINQYPQFDLPMALFAGGTGNDFHFVLYGEITLADQFTLVLDAYPTYVDAGYCNNQLFLNGVGIGFDGKVVQAMLGRKKWDKNMSYLGTVLSNILFFKEFFCTISNETFSWGKKCLMISVANGRRYGGKFLVNPEGLIDDRLLDISIIGHIPPLLRFKYLPSLEKGTHVNLPMVTYLRTGAIHIKTDTIIPAHVDGEYIDASEFTIQCLPARFLFLY